MRPPSRRAVVVTVRDVHREAGPHARAGPRLTPRQRGAGEPILSGSGAKRSESGRPRQNWGDRSSLTGSDPRTPYSEFIRESKLVEQSVPASRGGDRPGGDAIPRAAEAKSAGAVQSVTEGRVSAAYCDHRDERPRRPCGERAFWRRQFPGVRRPDVAACIAVASRGDRRDTRRHPAPSESTSG